MKNHATIIRMGASHWDVSVPEMDRVNPRESERMHFDLRAMTRDERRQFHAAFMSLYRKVNPMKERRAA